VGERFNKRLGRSKQIREEGEGVGVGGRGSEEEERR